MVAVKHENEVSAPFLGSFVPAPTIVGQREFFGTCACQRVRNVSRLGMNITLSGHVVYAQRPGQRLELFMPLPGLPGLFRISVVPFL